MPYLELWDQLSQNLTHVEASSNKIFEISQNVRTILQHILWRNIHHFLLCLSQASYINDYLRELQSDLFKNLREFYQISLKIDLISQISDFSVHSSWFVCLKSVLYQTKHNF